MKLRDLHNQAQGILHQLPIGPDRWRLSNKRVVIQTPDGHEYSAVALEEKGNRIVLSARKERD